MTEKQTPPTYFMVSFSPFNRWLRRLVFTFDGVFHTVLNEEEHLTIIRVTEPVTGLSFEGDNLTVNLKNTEKVDLEVKPLNRLGGPATGVTGSFSAITPTSAFTVEVDPGNPLKAVCKGNPNNPGSDADVGVVRFEGTRTASDGSTQPVTAEIAINILAADSATVEMVAGTPSEQ